MSLSHKEHIDSSTLRGKLFIASVYNNQDPLNLSRVQIYIPELFKNYSPSQYPWASVLYPVMRGAGINIGILNIPVEGSSVVVMFDDGAIPSPFVLGQIITGTAKITSFSGYPNTYGFIDENGTTFNVNTKTGVLTVNHFGTVFTIDNSGNISVKQSGILTWEANSAQFNIPNVTFSENVNIDGNLGIAGTVTEA